VGIGLPASVVLLGQLSLSVRHSDDMAMASAAQVIFILGECLVLPIAILETQKLTDIRRLAGQLRTHLAIKFFDHLLDFSLPLLVDLILFRTPITHLQISDEKHPRHQQDAVHSDLFCLFSL